jgi:transposase
MLEISVLGIDLAKDVFHVAGMNARGEVVLRKRIYRCDLEDFISSFPSVLIGMESCATCHYWARIFEKYGHQVRVMAAQFVKPYVKSNKNDILDAEAIAEAVTRPTMRFVPLKKLEQQDIQSLHRARERLVKSRTALINEMRGLLGEYGIVLPKGRNKFRQQIVEKLSEESQKLSSLSIELFWNLYEELVEIEQRVAYYEEKLKAICKAHPICQRLVTIPGIAYLSATAIIAAVGDMTYFRNGRAFAAWLGLVPRQYTTGGKPRLGRISKRGNCYLRKLLIHGARANLRYLERKTDRKSVWARKLKERSGSNKAAVAMANKTARAVWAMLTQDKDYCEYAYAA